MERLKSCNKVVGLKQSMKIVSGDRAEVVFVAEDADPWVVQPLAELCEEKNIVITKVPAMKELARACRIDVPAACAVLLKNSETN